MRNVNEEEGDDYFGCVAEDGFERVGSKRKPRLALRNLGVFMPENRPKPGVNLRNAYNAIGCSDSACGSAGCRPSTTL